VATRHEADFCTWALEQAAALRQGAELHLSVPVSIDWGNVAEEIEALGRADARELASRYYRVLAHLLKWQFEPQGRASSWRTTI
jgi:hypothetical protein